MSNVIPFPDSSKAPNEKKEIIYENFVIDDQDNEIDGYWPVYEKYLAIEELSYPEAAYISMIERLSTKYGWTQKPIDFFCKRLKVSRTTIYTYDLKLIKLNLLWKWEQSLGDVKGKIIERVSIPSAAMYYAVQRNHGYHIKAEDVHDNFIIKIKGYRKANPPIDMFPNKNLAHSVKEKTTQNIKLNLPDSPMAHSARSESEHVHARSESEHVLMTTSINIHNKNNNNIEQSSFSSNKELKEELEQCFKNQEDVNYGLRWIELKTPEERAKLESEIKSAIAAVKAGYAKKEVDAYDLKKKQEVEKIEAQKKEEIEKKQEKKSITNRNVKLAVTINNCFKNFKYLRIFYDQKTFRIVNEGLEQFQDEDGMTYRKLPSGDKFYGKPSLQINFEKEYETNFKESLKFFSTSFNINETQFKNILNKGVEYASV